MLEVTRRKERGSYFVLKDIYEETSEDGLTLKELETDTKTLTEELKRLVGEYNTRKKELEEICEYYNKLKGIREGYVEDIKKIKSIESQLYVLLIIKDKEIIELEKFQKTTSRINYKFIRLYYSTNGKVISQELIADDVCSAKAEIKFKELWGDGNGEYGRVLYYNYTKDGKAAKWLKPLLETGLAAEIH